MSLSDSETQTELGETSFSLSLGISPTYTTLRTQPYLAVIHCLEAVRTAVCASFPAYTLLLFFWALWVVTAPVGCPLFIAFIYLTLLFFTFPLCLSMTFMVLDSGGEEPMDIVGGVDVEDIGRVTQPCTIPRPTRILHIRASDFSYII